MLEFQATELPDIQLITPKRHGDGRGFFAETFRQDEFNANGINIPFVQDNHSLSAKGVLRGLHFQKNPHAQAKLVRVISGAIFDVAVDVRTSSDTFGQWVGRILSAENMQMLYVPVGFAHGFVALDDATEVLYKTSDYYAPDCECGIAWNDPDIGITWPEGIEEFSLSKKDTDNLLLAEAAERGELFL